jgi:membrane-bound lytic murein transglycosylase B
MNMLLSWLGNSTRIPAQDEISVSDAATNRVAASTAPVSSAPFPTASSTGQSGTSEFDAWRLHFKRYALDRGIRASTLGALDRARLIDGLVRLDTRQSEYRQTFFDYLNKHIGRRVEQGRFKLREHQGQLRTLEQTYGIPGSILIALWGLESSFGANQGDQDVLSSLATLAYHGRRKARFEDELLAALIMLEDGSVTADRFQGSWAGASGQPQFLPSTYLDHARDGDGDGHVDIWDSVPDTLASAANYLFNLGWQRNIPWGLEVRLPPGFDYYDARLDQRRLGLEWQYLGVTQVNGEPLPRPKVPASILLPAGHQGPAILVYDNFRVLTEWNRSLHYAFTVGHLADRIDGGGAFNRGPPAGDQALRRSTIQAMQNNLNLLGFAAGEADGMVGRQTRAAIRAYQRDRGLPADAYPTLQLTRSIQGDIVATVQRSLQARGLNPGPIDGAYGKRTRSAIEDYEQANGMRTTGRITPMLWERLQL